MGYAEIVTQRLRERIEREDTSYKPSKKELKNLIEELEREKSCGKGSRAKT